MKTIKMSELEAALNAKGYKTTREEGYSIVMTFDDMTDKIIVGGDYYPDDLANEDNLSWWVEGEDDDEDTVASGGTYDEEYGDFTVETIAQLIDEFQY